MLFKKYGHRLNYVIHPLTLQIGYNNLDLKTTLRAPFWDLQ